MARLEPLASQLLRRIHARNAGPSRPRRATAACRVERTELSLAARDDGCNLYSPVVSVIGAVATNTRASGGSVIGFTRERLRKKTPFSEGLRTNRARQE